jgi:hypothetical protein
VNRTRLRLKHMVEFRHKPISRFRDRHSFSGGQNGRCPRNSAYVLPLCSTCGVPMWLVKVEQLPTSQGRDRLHFECKACGARPFFNRQHDTWNLREFSWHLIFCLAQPVRLSCIR